MLDDFFIRAVLAGLGLAVIAAPVGCFVVWRGMAYFGDTLAHSALLGMSLGLLLEINPILGVFLLALGICLCLFLLRRSGSLSSDTVLGLLSHGALALGLVVLSVLTWVRIDLMAFLFGDILAVKRGDLLMIFIAACLVLPLLAYLWRPLLASTVNREIAQAEGQAPERVEIVFLILVALIVALAIKLVGALLITALLIMPAAAARSLAKGPESMALLAGGIGILSVVGGLQASLHLDSPSGPSIVVAALFFFLAVRVGTYLRKGKG